MMRLSRRIEIATGNGGISMLGFDKRGIVTSCRAVLLPRFGGPEVLEFRDNVSVPDLKPNQVLVRARAVSVNPLDTRVSSTFLILFSNFILIGFELSREIDL